MGGVIGGILGGGGGGSPPPIVPAPPPVQEAPPAAPPVKEFRTNANAGASADANAQRRFAAGFAQNIKNGALGLLNNAQTQKQKLGQ